MPYQFAVFGNPIEHSKSPQIHHLFAEQFNLHIEYDKRLSTEIDFANDLNFFFHNGGTGCNVTVPFKEQAFSLCDVLSPEAARAGAVNTVWRNEKNQLCGHNTDGIGLVRDLRDNHQVNMAGARVVIIGAGGAARGILAPFIEQNPASITIANRTASRSASLAQEFADLFQIDASGTLPLEYTGSVDLLVNATSASLSGALPLDDASLITDTTVCYDLAYASKPTSFMQWAKKHDAANVIDGKGMLVEQAAFAFSSWTGYTPDTSAIIKFYGLVRKISLWKPISARYARHPSRVDDWRADGLSNRQDPLPFPVAARQTGRAVFLHPAFSWSVMPSPTEGFAVSLSAG